MNPPPATGGQAPGDASALARRMLRSSNLRLVLALLGMFLLFAAAIGFQGAYQAARENAARVGRPDNLAQPRSPASEGWEAARRFTGARNLETIARQTTIVGLAALGMTLIIVSGGIDLSVGSMVALATVMIAWFLGRYGAHLPLAAAFSGVVVCAAAGLLNGLLITRLRVVPFIITMGMMLLVRGFAKGLAHEQKIDAPQTWLNELLASLVPEQRWRLVPNGVWVLVLSSVLVAFVLRYTRLGRHAYALGSNELTARLCGVAVDRVKVYVYTLGGIFAGLAGVMQFSRLTVGDPTVAVGLELDVIAAVVIGGGSLSGGEGSIFGSLIGALIMSVIRSGCSQMGLHNWVQEIITGAIIIAAVALDRLRHRKAA